MRRQRPEVPWSLESIVRHCLAPDPAQRYQQAEHLAEDLRRFLEDRPLKYAPELSRTERVRKWLRRNPRLTSSGSVATAATLLLAAAGFALAGVRDHLNHTRQQLQADSRQGLAPRLLGQSLQRAEVVPDLRRPVAPPPTVVIRQAGHLQQTR